MTTGWFILARAFHFGACLVFFGLLVFNRFVATPAAWSELPAVSAEWSARVRRAVRISLGIILISGMDWFVLIAVTMSSLPWTRAVHPEVLSTVWRRTDFGLLWRIRSLLWLGSVAAVAFETLSRHSSARRGSQDAQLLCGGLLLGSLGWAAHGRDGPPWHLAADVAHLLVAGCWPTGLLPLGLLVRRLRRESAEPAWRAMGRIVRRFSAVSLGSVAVLAVTGWLNAVVLVGSLSNLFHDAYGRWLLLKLVLFGIAVAIGTANLLQLKPRFALGGQADCTARKLQRNVQWELILGTAIVVVVAVLGILPPASR